MKKIRQSSRLILLLFSTVCVFVITACNKDEPGTNETGGDPEVPHMDFVEMISVQTHENNPDVIWYDDFSSTKEYIESRGEIDHDERFGTSGGSVDFGFDKGDVTGHGDRKVMFGDFPIDQSIARDGEKFDEIYWRIYVKHEYGWRGAPAKMSRATSIISENWPQAMIAHVWSGDDNSLTLDPARGVENQTDMVVTTAYNDFNNLSWLGNKPSSDFKISSTEESGYWVLVEVRAKLNTPGSSDGINQLWIDGRLEVERTELNFRGSYTTHGINAVFLESYWNEGATKTEGRWFDNFVISTQPIGPIITPANPTLYKTPYHGEGELANWEIELASDYAGDDVVFTSGLLGTEEKVKIDENMGTFSGSLSGAIALGSGIVYFTRVRQQNDFGVWSEWSRWHQPFKIE